MELNLSEIWGSMGPDAAFRIANEARPNADYFFNSLLPERNSYSYDVRGGNIVVRSVMAGLAAMDSPYPEGGSMSASTFLEKTAKIANRVRLPEESQRELQQMVMYLRATGAPTTEAARNILLNFYDKLVMQPQFDTAEWLRGQALVNGAIDWTYNKKRLLVDYQVPTANKLTARTGNNGYGGSTSKFWTDIVAAKRILKQNVRMFVGHPDTIDMIVSNTVNALYSINFEVINETTTRTTLVQKVTDNETRPNPDTRYAVTLIGYGGETEIIDLSDPTSTIIVKFFPTGKLIAVGNNAGRTFSVGDGSTPIPQEALGYTHVAPTTEGGGRPGRWGKAGQPEGEEWAFEGKCAANLLPVLTAPEKVVIMTTDMT